MCWQETVFAHEESYVFLNILVLLCGPFSISFLKPMGCQQNGKLLITGAYKSLVQYLGTYFSVLIIPFAIPGWIAHEDILSSDFLSVLYFYPSRCFE